MSNISSARWLVGLAIVVAACSTAPDASQVGAGGAGGEAPGGMGGAAGAAGTTGTVGTTGTAGTTGAAGVAPDAAVAGTTGAAGVSPDAGTTDGVDEPTPPARKATMVAVGWGGVRVRSTDSGKTWGDRAQLATGPDEPTLLRGVTYGAGVWVAVGVPVFTSPDGATWTPRDNPTKTQYGTQWFGGVAYGNGRFVAAGGCGVTMWSSDGGATWTKGPELSVGNCMDHMRSVAFGGGQFAAAGDKKIVHVTTDGVKWTVLAGLSVGNVVFCDGAFKDATACPSPTAEGVFLRSGGGWPKGSIDRSTNGKDWQRVHDDPNPMAAFGFGFSAD